MLPLSTHILFGFRLDSSDIFWKALVIVVSFLSFKRITHASLHRHQGTSDTSWNQAFETVKFMTIVNSSGIFGICFLTSNFLFLRMSYRKCYCPWSIEHARPSFGLQDLRSFGLLLVCYFHQQHTWWNDW